MAKRGRKPGFKMTDEHRAKIANSQILKRLIEAAEGKVEMTSVQATVALGLLRKVMPDLASLQHQGDEESPVQARIEIVTGVPRDKD